MPSSLSTTPSIDPTAQLSAPPLLDLLDTIPDHRDPAVSGTDCQPCPPLPWPPSSPDVDPVSPSPAGSSTTSTPTSQNSVLTCIDDPQKPPGDEPCPALTRTDSIWHWGHGCSHAPAVSPVAGSSPLTARPFAVPVTTPTRDPPPHTCWPPCATPPAPCWGSAG